MVSEPEEPVPYRTRSGRAVRQVPRYEPDENTIFVDGESSDSDFRPDADESDGDVGDESSDVSSVETDAESEDESEDEDDSEVEDESEVEDLLEDDDILDWDRLTDDASDDEDTEDDQYGDDEDEE